ncbi:DUF559 domain-containing protein [Demequina phytophila]|uniref:DUF559 domain-containing protein n=1 Tax=Demequina phytophila TaxID=1638981 RepID=UPI000781EA51|nr:DUF559 domain-containing protein [Demequina phytophila]
MDPVIELTKRGGAARRKDLLAKGVTRALLSAAVAEGAVRRPMYGIYALPDASTAQILRAAYRADLACMSLCVDAGLPTMDGDTRTHLWVPRNRARRADDRRPVNGVVIHRHDHVATTADERLAVGLDLMGLCHDRMAQIVAIDAALRLGKLTPARIEAFTHTDRDRLRWLLAHCDGLSQSILETIARVTLVAAGFRVVSQAKVPGIGHVDLLVEGRVIVELDGKEHHDKPGAWEEDIRRNNAAAAAGLHDLHFTYATVMYDRPAMVRMVRQALER